MCGAVDVFRGAGVAVAPLALHTVIVRIEHTQEYALTKTTRTDEEEIARLLL